MDKLRPFQTHRVDNQPPPFEPRDLWADDEVLREAGITDLSGYAVDPSQPLLPDLFLD